MEVALCTVDRRLCTPPRLSRFTAAHPLRFGAEPLGPIRRMLAARAADAGLPTDRAQDLILAVSEAMTNSTTVRFTA